MREIVDDSWTLFHTANVDSPRFFRFGDVLADIDMAGSHVRPRTLSVPVLRHHLDRLGDYTATKATGDEHPARPPKDVLESMIAVLPQSLPLLVGVTNAPFIAPDGTMQTLEGYHVPTGLYLALGGLTVPPVPPHPSASEVAHAKDLLLTELLGDFPFSEEADRTHALAALVSPLIRPLIDGPTPLFVIEAPTEGSGKGLLAEVISYLATGRPAPVMAEGGDDDEWRKRLTAALLGTPPVLLIDNVKRRLESGALSAAITATVWTDRFLGHSRLVSIPVRTTWLATGNNPTYSKEIARRVVQIRIDAAMEHPWERKGFRHPDLRGWIRQERPRLLWASLTLAQAWVAGGRCLGPELLGSFERWSATLGGILNCIGVSGFLANREAVYAQAETEGEAWKALLDIWWRNYDVRRVGVSQLFDLAASEKLLTDLRAGRTERGARTAMGMELSKLRDRIVGDYCIREAGVTTEGGAAYRLEKRGNEGDKKVL